MTTRTHIPLLFILSLVGGFFVSPTISSAATAANGTTCALVAYNNSCLDETGTSLGPAYGINASSTISSTIIDPNNVKINGCKLADQQVKSVGTWTAIGGTYVPVYDASVTLNTGYLVFKECVLDAIAAELRQASMAKLVGENLKVITQGANGNPLFVQNLALEDAKIAQRTFDEFYKSDTVEAISPAFRTNVVNASIADYYAKISGTQKSYAGSFENEEKQRAFLDGKLIKAGGWIALETMYKNLANSPGFARLRLNNERDLEIARAQQDYRTQLNWGDGAIPGEMPVNIPTENGNKTIYLTVTPGKVVMETLVQVLGSGFRQQEQAEEYDQLIDTSFSGLSARVLSDNKGLVGATQPTPAPGGNGSSGPSYVDQMFQTILDLIQKIPTTGGVGSSALPTLQTTVAREQQFLTFRQQVSTYLAAQSQKLTLAQDTCWTTIAQAVAVQANGVSYTVATSSTYATAATATLITPVKTIVQQDVDRATTTIAVLQSLITDVTNSNTEATNQAALQQIAALTANNTLHTTTDITAAQQSVTDIKTTVGVKVDATIAAWKQGTEWCNASSTAVVQSWLNQWKN